MFSKLIGRLFISQNSPISTLSSVYTFKGIWSCDSSTNEISGKEGLRLMYEPKIINIANKQLEMLIQKRNLTSLNIRF